MGEKAPRQRTCRTSAGTTRRGRQKKPETGAPQARAWASRDGRDRPQHSPRSTQHGALSVPSGRQGRKTCTKRKACVTASLCRKEQVCTRVTMIRGHGARERQAQNHRHRTVPLHEGTGGGTLVPGWGRVGTCGKFWSWAARHDCAPGMVNTARFVLGVCGHDEEKKSVPHPRPERSHSSRAAPAHRAPLQ